MKLSRVLMVIAILSLQEKPRVSLKKFVKIGTPGYKGRKSGFASDQIFRISNGFRNHSTAYTKCINDQNSLFILVTKQREQGSGQHSLLFQVRQRILKSENH